MPSQHQALVLIIEYINPQERPLLKQRAVIQHKLPFLFELTASLSLCSKRAVRLSNTSEHHYALSKWTLLFTSTPAEYSSRFTNLARDWKYRHGESWPSFTLLILGVESLENVQNIYHGGPQI